jgi:orotate phosphoribosyltransferase
MHPLGQRPRVADELRFIPSSEAVRQLGRPMRVVLPSTISLPSLIELGDNLWQHIEGQSVHLVAVATSGILIASSAFLATTQIHRLSSFTTVKPKYHFDTRDLRASSDDRVYIVDNSIHTGATALEATRSVMSRGEVAGFIKLVDYQDDLEHEVSSKMLSETGIPVMSLFRLDALSDRG